VDLSKVTWKKSSLSAISDCVEVALVDNQVALRDSKSPDGPVLFFSPSEWHAFVGGVRNGEFSQPE
jgi:hypothetical protein